MFEQLFSNFSVLELLGAGFGVFQVVLSRNNKVNNYLFGIAGILISLWIYYQAKLYADILLNLYYLIMSIYGWFYWKFGKNHHQAPISFSSQKNYLTAIGITLFCFFIMWYWLSQHTNSDVPLWDALVAGFAWAGMWLMAKRKIENWIFLNLSNLVAFPLLIYKELFIYAGFTVFLFVMGVLGYLKWKKLSQNSKLVLP